MISTVFARRTVAPADTVRVPFATWAGVLLFQVGQGLIYRQQFIGGNLHRDLRR
jgi:hypothetical protein